MAMPPPPSLHGARVGVTLVAPPDAAALLAFHERNWTHLKPWSPSPPADFLTAAYWRRWAAAAPGLYAQDRAVRLAVRPKAAPEAPLLGQVNISTIVRGPQQTCTLGFHADAAAEGRGLMTEALELALGFALGPLGLHRVEASYLPGNRRSARLLERLGFEVEGRARALLFIDGAWRDHLRCALVNPDPQPPPYTTYAAAPAPA
jgi:ribosomal-protein-alanine N-acetyltransferase